MSSEIWYLGIKDPLFEKEIARVCFSIDLPMPSTQDHSGNDADGNLEGFYSSKYKRQGERKNQLMEKYLIN